MKQVEDIVGGVGMMFVRISEGACNGVTAEDFDLRVNLSHVMPIIDAFFFEAVEIVLCSASERQKSGYLAVFSGSLCEMLQGFLMFRIDYFSVASEAAGVIGDELAAGCEDRDAISITNIPSSPLSLVRNADLLNLELSEPNLNAYDKEIKP